MTLLVVEKDDLGRAVELLGREVIAYSIPDSWVCVHKAEADNLVRTLEANGIKTAISDWK